MRVQFHKVGDRTLPCPHPNANPKPNPNPNPNPNPTHHSKPNPNPNPNPYPSPQTPHLSPHQVGVGRFPSVAFLQCCARNYEQPAAGAQQMRCFAKGCTQTACPARPTRGGGACSSAAVSAAAVSAAAANEQRQLGFKYRSASRVALCRAGPQRK